MKENLVSKIEKLSNKIDIIERKVDQKIDDRTNKIEQKIDDLI